MANNLEMAFLATARRLGELQAKGLDLAGEHEITHRFLSFSDDVALREALWDQSFRASERQDTPGFDARRPEVLSASRLKEVVEQLCRTADKYAAEYDGWDLTVGPDTPDKDS